MEVAGTWPLVDGRVRVTAAGPEEMPLVAALLDGASAWLESRGLIGWPRPFPVANLEAALPLGATYLARDGATPVGTFSLYRTDVAFWDERPNEPPGHAQYLHKLATSRAYPGLGRELVALAEQLASADGAACLRLDCVAADPGIRRYYEAAGFEYRGEVSGPAFATPYALYEKSLR